MPQIARNRLNLTEKAVERMAFDPDGPTTQITWDRREPGLGVRLLPSGRKRFVLRVRVGGRDRLVTLEAGKVAMAREEAQRRRGEVANGVGVTPAVTFERLVKAYEERHLPRKKSAADDRRRLGKLCRPRNAKGYGWGRRLVSSLTRSDLAAVHHEIGSEAPYEANRYLSLVSRVWGLGQTWGLVPEDAPNPAKGIERFKEESRERWVSAEEMPRLAKAIDAHPNPYVRAALWLYLLTGCRKTELLGARWEDVDLKAAELRIPAPKQGKPHRVPLSGPAVEILAALPRLESNPHVFPGRKPGAHLVNLNKPWNAIRADANLDGVRIHDLRRTVGSWLATSGHTLVLIGKVLGHTQARTTQVYTRLQTGPARAALEKHAEQLVSASGDEEASDPASTEPLDERDGPLDMPPGLRAEFDHGAWFGWQSAVSVHTRRECCSETELAMLAGEVPVVGSDCPWCATARGFALGVKAGRREAVARNSYRGSHKSERNPSREPELPGELAEYALRNGPKTLREACDELTGERFKIQDGVVTNLHRDGSRVHFDLNGTPRSIETEQMRIALDNRRNPRSRRSRVDAQPGRLRQLLAEAGQPTESGGT